MADVRDAGLTNPTDPHTFRSLFSELKTELFGFVRTRAQLLFYELHDKAGKLKKTAAFGAIAMIFGSVAFLLFTLAAVALVAVAFQGSPFAFFWGLLIIGICYLLLGGITGIVAFYGLKNLTPQKTIKMLQSDRAWVHAELSR